MNSISAIAILSLVLILIVVAYLAGKKQGGLVEDTSKQSAAKDENKQAVLALLHQHGELSNAEIRELLDVSARTVVNYMDELEKEGLVGQVGDTGRNVTYHLK